MSGWYCTDIIFLIDNQITIHWTYSKNIEKKVTRVTFEFLTHKNNERKILRVWTFWVVTTTHITKLTTKSCIIPISIVYSPRFCEEEICLVHTSCISRKKAPDIGNCTPNPTSQAWRSREIPSLWHNEIWPIWTLPQANFKQYRTHWYYLSIFKYC